MSRSTQPDSPVHPLPLISVGGFLGAGKTTLINHLLARANGKRFVVFVNDFGAINIDFELVDTIEEDKISLRNGCVCCTLNEDFTARVAEFSRQAVPPDGILVEASGVADPRALEGSLNRLEEAALIRVDSRVYLLDADQFDRHDYTIREESIDHAAVSDLVLINKSDLATADQLSNIRRVLTESAPYSHLVEAVSAAVEPDLILGGFHADAGYRRQPEVSKSHAADRYSSWSFVRDQPVSRDRFETFAKQLPTLCYRAKGIVQFETGRSWLFNQAGYRASLVPCSNEDIEPGCRLVFIGEINEETRNLLVHATDRLCAEGTAA